MLRLSWIASRWPDSERVHRRCNAVVADLPGPDRRRAGVSGWGGGGGGTGSQLFVSGCHSTLSQEMIFLIHRRNPEQRTISKVRPQRFGSAMFTPPILFPCACFIAILYANRRNFVRWALA